MKDKAIIVRLSQQILQNGFQSTMHFSRDSDALASIDFMNTDRSVII